MVSCLIQEQRVLVWLQILPWSRISKSDKLALTLHCPRMERMTFRLTPFSPCASLPLSSHRQRRRTPSSSEEQTASFLQKSWQQKAVSWCLSHHDNHWTPVPILCLRFQVCPTRVIKG